MRTLTERSVVIHMFLLNCGLFLGSSIQQLCYLLGFGRNNFAFRNQKIYRVIQPYDVIDRNRKYCSVRQPNH